MKMAVAFKGEQFVKGITLADTFWLKLSGYMFRHRPHVPGFLFETSGGIHTFFMLFPLDLVFLDKENRVIKVIRNLKPWRHTWFYPKTKRVLELPLGILPSSIVEGDTLEVQHV